jgi:hypothetical protein
MANPVMNSAENKSPFASFSSEKEEVFFFEKRNQKTFISWCQAGQ